MGYYPKNLKVDDGGTKSTIDFLNQVFQENDSFLYAELGIYKAETALYVLNRFPNAKVHLFDFDDVITETKKKLINHADRIEFYGNSYKFCDSYNYNLLEVIRTGQVIYDYVFLDGPHTFAIDGLAFFLIDILTKPGSYIDFDDYNWSLENSSLNPKLVPETSLCYTDYQIKSKQIKDLVDLIVKKKTNYNEIVKNKIFQKVN